MEKYFGIVVCGMICVMSSAFADHKHGPRSECWRDSKYNKHWAYYFCGVQKNRCDGKTSKGHDTVFWQYHGDSFTFVTSPTETYWCCNGSTSAEGKYVLGPNWIVQEETERISVEGGSCNKLIQTDICGGETIIECTEPDTCDPGYILRNKACVKPCGEDEIFENLESNTCIKCETTPYQGVGKNTVSKRVGLIVPRTIDIEYDVCIKCDKDTEFFNRQTKKCIKKDGLTKISPLALKACWRCPMEYLMKCAIEMEKPESQRGFAIEDWELIKKECYID